MKLDIKIKTIITSIQLTHTTLCLVSDCGFSTLSGSCEREECDCKEAPPCSRTRRRAYFFRL